MVFWFQQKPFIIFHLVPTPVTLYTKCTLHSPLLLLLPKFWMQGQTSCNLSPLIVSLSLLFPCYSFFGLAPKPDLWSISHICSILSTHSLSSPDPQTWPLQCMKHTERPVVMKALHASILPPLLLSSSPPLKMLFWCSDLQTRPLLHFKRGHSQFLITKDRSPFPLSRPFTPYLLSIFSWPPLHLGVYTIYFNKITSLSAEKNILFFPLPSNSLCNAVTDVSQRSEGYPQLKHIHSFKLLCVRVCV